MKKTKIRSGGLSKNKNPKIKIRKFGWTSEKRKPKGSGGLPKNENPKVKIHSGSGELLKNGRRRTFKIRSGGFPSVSSEEWKKPRFFSGLLKNNRKPRFVSFGIFRKSGTKIRKYEFGVSSGFR
ncbi:hypothetical protein GLOIN_2v1779851 [Rhizophagus irregularis DAOM 181602=DAOM 197198]|nr:hypothetical protein GLOIN_2v1779851 [Rhizophagus irregularis DAOM 181602=DAOM 197198]